MTRRTFERSESDNVPPLKAANAIADSLMAEEHPLFPGRVQQIVESLVADKWAEQPSIRAPFEFK
jgi:hypothetical protein